MISNLNLKADQLLQATIRKWGTDEEEVYSILQEVHDAGLRSAFEEKVEKSLTFEEGYQFRKFQRGSGETSVVQWILSEEMGGAEQAKAEDLLNVGEDTHRAGYFDYLIQGAALTFDFSRPQDIIVAGAVTAVLIGISFTFPPVASLIGSTLVFAGAANGVKDFAYGLGGVYFAKDDVGKKEAVAKLGKGLSCLLTTLPFLPSALKTTSFMLGRIYLNRQTARLMEALKEARKSFDEGLSLLQKEKRLDQVLSFYNKVSNTWPLDAKLLSSRVAFDHYFELTQKAATLLERHGCYAQAADIWDIFVGKNMEPLFSGADYASLKLPYAQRAGSFYNVTSDFGSACVAYGKAANCACSAGRWEEAISALKEQGLNSVREALRSRTPNFATSFKRAEIDFLHASERLKNLATEFAGHVLDTRAQELQTSIQESLALLSAAKPPFWSHIKVL